MTEAMREPRDLGPDLLWEIPLALLSWAFFHLNKAVIARLYQAYLDRQAERSRSWQLFSEQTLRRPVSLPVLLTKGPRWNTHAAIGTLGPLEVRQSLAVQTGLAVRSAGAWSVVLYGYPDFRTLQEIGALDRPDHPEWTELALPQGRYCLGVRYYGRQPGATLPAVRVDGAAAVAAEPVPAEVNAVYEHLAERTTLYHHALHHYVHTMLRLRRWLPATLVRREFLPVGDPCTEFRYGWFPAGRALELHAEERLRRDFRLYLSVYNRASLPVFSAELSSPLTMTAPFPEAGFYLIRLRPRSTGVAPVGAEELRVRRPALGASGPLA